MAGRSGEGGAGIDGTVPMAIDPEGRGGGI